MPCHGGFGMMNLYGVPEPIYRARCACGSLTRPTGGRWVSIDWEAVG